MSVLSASTVPVSSRHGTRGVFFVCLSVSLFIHALLLALNPARPSAADIVSGTTDLQLDISRRSPPAITAAPMRSEQPARLENESPADRIAFRTHGRLAGSTGPAPQAHAADAQTPPEVAQPGAMAGRPTGAALETLLHDRIHRAMQPYFNYPLLARRRGWQGTVEVSLRVEANGHLSQVRLVHPSPHAVLNRAAMDNLEKVGAIPEAVRWLAGNHLDIVLPVEYRLLGS